MPFVFASGQSAETLVARLRDAGWWGEILGPHGTGKSVLLATLMPAIERAGRRPVLIELHDGQRRLPSVLRRADIPVCHPVCPGSESPEDRQECLSSCGAEPPTLLIVDGCEQLTRWNRWRMKRLCRRRGWGLLVTAHASVGLPELCRTAATPELAETIIERLMAGRTRPFSAAEVTDCFARHRGNLREMLFELYDLYEQRRPSSGQNLT
jgi:hypothetical protein